MRDEPIEHLQTELQRLDLLLHREILRLRAGYQLSLDEFRGLYISDEQVGHLIDQALGHEGPVSAIEELTQNAEALREASAAGCSADLPWKRLASAFSLTPIEQDILLIAAAPEIDLKYETLYAYLNNDVTRKWPTFDLVLRLLGTDRLNKLRIREHLDAESTLFASSLLRPIQPAADRPNWLAGGFHLSPSVLQFILERRSLDPSLTSFVEVRNAAVEWDELPLTSEQSASLRRLVKRLIQPEQPARMLVLEGRYGAGRHLVAEAICRELDILLMSVDLEAARLSAEPIPRLLNAVKLHQRLHRAGIYVARSDTWFDKEGKPLPEYRLMLKCLSGGSGPVILECEPGVDWRELLRGYDAVCFRFDDPDYNLRLGLWEASLSHTNVSITRTELEALADRFVLTPGQIAAAVRSASDELLNDDPVARRPEPHQSGADAAATSDADRSTACAALFSAARSQSDQNIGRLAVKVNSIHSWNDLILPGATLRRVKEVAAAIKYRHVVYSEWGFENRIATGKGLKALFSGASGTGKTMTAGVIARDLGLDLYKIDLSGIVSKYIGETEKNLDRIFRAAHSSNAMLFFDEADALFGKRSEVKDAHDRYANIEVAYLLQKIEEYEGVVILASNLSKNIDDAFSRRVHYVVEFPLPDERHREMLWRGMFPPQVPLDSEVDFQFLAKQFPISGGDIRNVALDAAFLAAQDGRVITIRQLIKALARQMLKQGKIPSPADLKQYHYMLDETG